MKTVSQVFTTGVKEITTEPAFYKNVVEFNGSYYKVGGKRLEVRALKVENKNFYILTLAAVEKELNRRGMRNANILLFVGLSLTRFGAEKLYGAVLECYEQQKRHREGKCLETQTILGREIDSNTGNGYFDKSEQTSER